MNFFSHSLQAQNLTLSTPTVLEVIQEVKLNNLSEAHLEDKAFISQWFDVKLGPFLPSVTPTFLTCLTNQSFSCETFQAVYVHSVNLPCLMQFHSSSQAKQSYSFLWLYPFRVAALSNRSRDMNEEQKKAIFTRFLYPFLSRADSPGLCSRQYFHTGFVKRFKLDKEISPKSKRTCTAIVFICFRSWLH